MATNTSSGDNAPQSSDMSFYVFMLAIIVAMAFYISYDMEQRYGSGAAVSGTTAAEPVVISVEQAISVEIKPVAEIPATATTPEVIVVEKTEQKTIVTTAIVPVQEAAAPVEAEVVVEEKAAPEVTTPAADTIPMFDSMIQTIEKITTPVVEKAEAVVNDIIQPAPPAPAAVVKAPEEVQPAPVPVAQSIPEATPAAPDYNPYADQYGRRPYQDYQQPQQYGNPYGNPYNSPYNNNSYNNQYNNPYANPYGYGNPYQQPSQ